MSVNEWKWMNGKSSNFAEQDYYSSFHNERQSLIEDW